MLSLKKIFNKKALKVFVIAIIIFITVSIVSTKLIYDSVFQRYEASVSECILGENADIIDSRTQYSYQCLENTLNGYLYTLGNCKYGLIVLVPGFHAENIEYEGVIAALVREGFDVFSFDPTGHGTSEGESSVGYPQIITDTNATLEFIRSRRQMFDYSHIFLLGHSRGGYGVCCSMNDFEIIDAAISINGTDTSMDAIMAYSTAYVGNVAYSNYPFLSLYESMIFGSSLSESSSVDEINQSEIPVLIIQSENDEVIQKNKYSLYAHKNEITSQSTQIMLYNKKGFSGHTNILYDKNRRANADIIKSITNFYKKIHAGSR